MKEEFYNRQGVSAKIDGNCDGLLEKLKKKRIDLRSSQFIFNFLSSLYVMQLFYDIK